jgi:hypothetical protein
MPRLLRIYLLACIALAFGYLVRHAGEPLRLNVGDAWTDANVVSSIELVEQHGFARDTANDPLGVDPFRPIHDPPLAELFYGAVGKLFGTHEITVFRILAIAFSALAAWLLYQYARRMWNDSVALIATALFTTSLLWLMFADSVHRAPIMHAACFLALWGVVRAPETGLRRHYAAALLGTFACLVTASNDWLFLPMGVLFTVYIKRGDPLARGNWQVIAACAAGGLLAIVLRAPFVADPIDWHAVLDRKVSMTLVTQLRRYTLLLSPLVWIPLAVALWRAIRAPSVKAAIDDGMTWMLVAAAVFAYGPAPRPESAMLRVQLLLPFYAIASAMLIARLFESGGWVRRALAIAWCGVAPLWAFWIMFSHPREVLDRDDVARANEYLAANDRNDFVMSNLLADGPLVAAFDRHGWPPPNGPDPFDARATMIAIFELTGAEYAHAIIFKTPGSRFVDRSITQVMRRRMASVDGWPHLVRAKVNSLIAKYDREVLRNLDVVGAKNVLQLGNFDIYRIDRATLLDAAARSLPVAREIDFANLGAGKHKLLGWGGPLKEEEESSLLAHIAGYARCANPILSRATPAPNGCTVVDTPTGLQAVDVTGIGRADLLVRVDRVCDQQLTITFRAPARVDVSYNGVAVLTCGDPQWGSASVSVRVPERAVRLGANVIALDDTQVEPRTKLSEVKSVVIEPICASARDHVESVDKAR